MPSSSFGKAFQDVGTVQGSEPKMVHTWIMPLPKAASVNMFKAIVQLHIIHIT